MTSITKGAVALFSEASPEQTPKVSLLGYLSRLFGCAHNRRKADRFAAEREIVWQTYQAASRRRDTRGMNAASAQMQALTTAQLRAELGRR